MPLVVPSQVVALIDHDYPNTKDQPQFSVYSGNAASLAAIVTLTEAIPAELLTISGTDYSDFVQAIEALKTAMTRWNQRGGDDPPARVKGDAPVAVIRRALSKCPDQQPSVGTATLQFIADTALRDSIRVDVSNAANALHNADYKASTVLAGAAVEALLLWAIQRPAYGGALAAIPGKPKGDPDQWALGDFIQVASALSIIKASTADQARLAKDFRNLIHPGRAQRTAQVCDRGTALAALAAVEFVIRDLS